MKKLLFLTVLFLCTVGFSMAGPVSPERAQRVAENFARSHGFYDNGKVKVDVTNLTSSTPFTQLYVFDFTRSNGTRGFVIVSGDDIARPILGYSAQNAFEVENMPAHVQSWFEDYEHEIGSAREQGLQPSEFITQQWLMLEGESELTTDNTIIVSPLIQTQWDQSPYYNNLCPWDSGANSRCVTGCVATAMAQVMKYWNHPIQGIGSHSYTSSYGTLSADFSATTYDWANMPNTLSSSSSSTQVNAVATLIYHCGVAVNMSYSPSGSSATTIGSYGNTAESALLTYFGYGSSIDGEYQSNYTDSAWKNMVMSDLNAGRPLMYRGSGNYGGHSFVCDGYNSDTLFHFNWGWSGSYNGYFSLSALAPGSYSFSSGQGAIFGISPDDRPFNITASAIETNSVILTWLDPNESTTTSYTIAYGLASTFNIDNASTYTTTSSTTNSIALTGLSQLTTYCVKVRSVAGSSYSGWSPTYTFTTLPTCPQPTTLHLVSATNSTVTVAWSAGGSETSWQVSNGIDSVLTTATSHTFTNLDLNTLYDISVRGICRVGDTSQTTTAIARTTCDAIGHSELPYTEGFEDWTAGSNGGTDTWRPDNYCWTYTTNYSSASYHYPYVYNGGAHTGNKSLYMFKSGYSYWADISLPRFEDSVAGLVVRCFIKKTSSSGDIQVGVKTDLDDESSFTSVATFSPTLQSVWQEFEVSLSSYVGDEGFITFRAPLSSGYNYAYIDDIIVFSEPSCWRPTSLEALSYGSNSLNVSWTPDTRSTGTYLLEYGPEGFTVGTGTTISTTDTMVTLTGLSAGSYYDVYVRTLCQVGDTSESRMTTAHVRCADISHNELPYSYGFEDATSTGSAGTINPCWTKGMENSPTISPYPYSVAHGGNRGLRFYSTYSGARNWVVLPTFEDNLSDLQLTFWLRAASQGTTYDNTIRVGVMDDPYDISTFEEVGSYTATSTTSWDSFTVFLGTYNGSGRHVAFLAYNVQGGSFGLYLDDVEVDAAPTCGPVSDMSVTSSAYSAMVTWQPCVIGDTPQQYTVGYREAGTSSWNTAGTTANTYYALTNLSLNSDYEVRVAANCSSDNSNWNYASFSTSRCTEPSSDVTIGTSNNQTSSVPVYSSYGNTMCQSIYTAEELSDMGFTAGTIVSLQYAWTNNSSYAKVFTVYMGHTNVSSYSSTSVDNFISFDNQTLVYSGSHPLNTSGAVTYTLTSPFEWDGTSNIVVTTFMNQPNGSSHYSSGFYGISSNCGSYRSQYSYKDATAYTISNYTSYSNIARTTYRPNVTFMKACDENPVCAAPVPIVESVTSNSAHLIWAPGNNETSWNVYYKRSSASDYCLAASSITTTHYTLSGLLPGRSYVFKVEALCSNQSRSATASATTLAGSTPLPFTCDFEVSDNDGWTFINGSQTNKWFIGPATNNGGSRSMYISNYSDGSSLNYNINSASYVFVTQLVSIPEAGEYVYSYDWKTYGESYYDYMNVALVPESVQLTAGSSCGFSYTSVPTGAIRLFPSGRMNLQSNWASVADTVTVATPGNYNIVVYWHNDGSVGTNPPGCIDNISFAQVAPEVVCSEPTNLAVSSVTSYSVTLTWTHGGDETSWQVSDGTDTYTTTTNSYTFTDLTPNTTYTFSVSSICGADNISDPATITTTTSIEPTPICTISEFPYTENFDTYTASTTAKTGVEPPCWTLVHQDVTMADEYKPMVYYSSSRAHSGNYSLILNKRGYYAMPAIDTMVSSLQLSMYLVQQMTKYQLEVGVMTDLDDLSTFTLVQTINNSTTSSEQITVDFGSYTGTGRYIVFHNILAPGNSGSYSCNYLDDLTLTLRPDDPEPDADTCIISTFPYTENFDTYTASTTAKTGVEPPCWTLVHQDVAMADEYRPMIYYEPTRAHSGSHSLLLNKRGYYAMPAVDTAVSNLQLTMYLLQRQSKYRLEVGVMTDLDDLSTFTLVQTVDNATTSIEQVTVDFGSYTGTGRYIVFHNVLAPGNSGDFSCNYIDDLTLTLRPDNPEPDEDTCLITTFPYTEDFDTYTTSTTAKTGVEPDCWTLVHQDVSMSDEYKPMIYYSSSRFHSGSYSLILNKRGYYAMPAVDTTVSSLQLSMYLLQQYTKYQLEVGVMTDLDDLSTFTWVQTIDNSSTSIEQVTVDFGSYTGTGRYIVFHNILASGYSGSYSCNYLDDLTLALRPDDPEPDVDSCTIATFPYTENFDGYTTSTTAKTGVEPDCWTLVHQDVSMTDEYKPMVYYESSKAHSGSYSLILNKRGYYAMPEVGTDVRNLRLTMYLLQQYAKYQLEVGVMTDLGDLSTFTLVQTINNATTSSEQVTVDFSTYTGTGRYIVFHNVLASGYSGNFSCNYIDDLTLMLNTSTAPMPDGTEDATADNEATEDVAVQDEATEETETDLTLTPDQPQLTLYPNPTSGLVTIASDREVLKVEVYDYAGRLATVLENRRELDLSSLASGMYTLRITLPDAIEVRRVIKK